MQVEQENIRHARESGTTSHHHNIRPSKAKKRCKLSHVTWYQIIIIFISN